MINIQEHNSTAWDREVDISCEWTVPVDSETIAAARRGDWTLRLAPLRPVPREWFGDIVGKDLLCLASGGGQQAPKLAAAGAKVTSFDNSAKQLEQDMLVAEREGLNIRIEKGDAADLSRFADGSFDLIYNPCSNLFMPDLKPVWAECFRVLRPGGTLLVGFVKPELFIFDLEKEENEGVIEVRFKLPYSDVDSLTEAELQAKIESGEPLEYSHTLEDQIGGQTATGFHIVGLFEDYWADSERPLNGYFPNFVATRAVKP
jgi:SAM-dependent methyltransferase